MKAAGAGSLFPPSSPLQCSGRSLHKIGAFFTTYGIARTKTSRPEDVQRVLIGRACRWRPRYQQSSYRQSKASSIGRGGTRSGTRRWTGAAMDSQDGELDLSQSSLKQLKKKKKKSKENTLHTLASVVHRTFPFTQKANRFHH